MDNKYLLVTATPAYGAKYDSAFDVVEAWQQGKDFKYNFTDQYFSVRDTETILKDSIIFYHFNYIVIKLYDGRRNKNEN